MTQFELQQFVATLAPTSIVLALDTPEHTSFYRIIRQVATNKYLFAIRNIDHKSGLLALRPHYIIVNKYIDIPQYLLDINKEAEVIRWE